MGFQCLHLQLQLFLAVRHHSIFSILVRNPKKHCTKKRFNKKTSRTVENWRLITRHAPQIIIILADAALFPPSTQITVDQSGFISEILENLRKNSFHNVYPPFTVDLTSVYTGNTLNLRTYHNYCKCSELVILTHHV